MLQKNQIFLSSHQKRALDEIKRNVNQQVHVKTYILFGSVVKNSTDNESDIDLLIITDQKLDRPSRHQITNIVFEINLQYDTNFSTLVVDEESWENGLFSVLPIKENISRNGITI